MSGLALARICDRCGNFDAWPSQVQIRTMQPVVPELMRWPGADARHRHCRCKQSGCHPLVGRGRDHRVTAPRSLPERANIKGVDLSNVNPAYMITAVDGEQVHRLSDLSDRVEQVGAGKTVRLSLEAQLGHAGRHRLLRRGR